LRFGIGAGDIGGAFLGDGSARDASDASRLRTCLTLPPVWPQCSLRSLTQSASKDHVGASGQMAHWT